MQAQICLEGACSDGETQCDGIPDLGRGIWPALVRLSHPSPDIYWTWLNLARRRIQLFKHFLSMEETEGRQGIEKIAGLGFIPQRFPPYCICPYSAPFKDLRWLGRCKALCAPRFRHIAYTYPVLLDQWTGGEQRVFFLEFLVVLFHCEGSLMEHL